MNERVPTRVSVNPPAPAQAYSYDNSRPLSVFALADAATLGVFGLTWGAHAALKEAAAEQHIAPPPDLKKVVERVESALQMLTKVA